MRHSYRHSWPSTGSLVINTLSLFISPHLQVILYTYVVPLLIPFSILRYLPLQVGI